jgi:hypothetical protein
MAYAYGELRGVPLVRTRERVEWLQYNVNFFNGVDQSS